MYFGSFAIPFTLLTAVPGLSHAQVPAYPISNALSSAIISEFGPVPSFSPMETVGELVDLLMDEDIPDDGTGSAAVSSGAASNTRTLAARAAATPLPPIGKAKNRRFLSAVYNSTDGHGAYKLVIPGCLSGGDLLGDFEHPNGTMIVNATLQDLIKAMQLPGPALYNYTLTMVNKTYNNINMTLDRIICEGPQGATRDLLWPGFPRPNWRDPDNSEGFMTAFLLGLFGVTSIGYVGTRLAVIHQGITANISMNTEVAILAGTAAAEFIFATMIWRLQSVERRWVGRLEAAVLNGFITAGARLLRFLEYVSGHSCISTGTAQQGLSSLMAAAGRQVQVIRTGMVQSLSSTSLLGMTAASSSNDVEAQGNAVQVGLRVANEAVQLQLSGGDGLRQTCG